ncbi:hypothetical protein Tdes44962_MAKER01023 [Teratosphaeria destructans]|uniref:Uncharacterized protein n=1 Tax=Teratosphaeria destructans TaxID=418781 RepID=A0A9W7VY91_9PEZI|nr:hypothetical protein Tdes44962_MAKER01023 [Teratosphaeria destructans]
MITPPTSSPFIFEDDRPLAKSTGAVWLWPSKENGKYWPVMLCPDTIHPRDPEWIEDNSLIPAFLLGHRKWIWVRDDERLKPWDASHYYLHGLARFEHEDIVDGDDKVAKIEKQWRRAYRQDAMQLWGPEQWLNYMQNESAIKELELGMKNKAKVKYGRVLDSGRRPGHADDESSGSQVKRRKLNPTGESYRTLALTQTATPKCTPPRWSKGLRVPSTTSIALICRFVNPDAVDDRAFVQGWSARSELERCYLGTLIYESELSEKTNRVSRCSKAKCYGVEAAVGSVSLD